MNGRHASGGLLSIPDTTRRSSQPLREVYSSVIFPVIAGTLIVRRD